MLQNIRRRSLFIAAAAFACAAVVWSVVYANELDGRRSRESSNSFSSLHMFPPTATNAIANSSSVLIRNRNGVWYYITTIGLVPNGPYTNWWVIFNHPEFCSAPECGAKDFPQNGGDPNVQASVLWATGRVADANGHATFSANLTADGAVPGFVIFGPGLLNPRAEIHIIVRSHGAASTDPKVLEAQLTTPKGGCTTANPLPCPVDQQAVQHFPEGSGE
jgi:hypothetical protein